VGIDFLYCNPIWYAGLLQCIARGTADVLEENEHGIFLRDTVSDAYMLTTGNTEEGIRWLKKHEALQYPLLALFQSDLVAFARKRYALLSMIDSFQAVYEKKEPPVCNKDIEIQVASEEDDKLIAAHYTLLNEQKRKKVIRSGKLFLGRHKGEVVGFIGQHLEGSMGLLEILPEHRGKGYGTALESYLIARMLAKGQLPFCQIEADNEKSLNLQKKLGLTISNEHIYWLF
jgi:GNAT superfamily N-acetyltransferase